MKLHFESNLDYQHDAIESVCDLFRGHEICRTEFTVTRDAAAAQQTMAFAQSNLGIGNRLQLLDDEILTNLSNIQLRNGLRPSASVAIHLTMGISPLLGANHGNMYPRPFAVPAAIDTGNRNVGGQLAARLRSSRAYGPVGSRWKVLRSPRARFRLVQVLEEGTAARSELPPGAVAGQGPFVRTHPASLRKAC
jgi:hypothetical protein